MKKRKPGRPPGRGPGRPALLHSPGISSKGPLPAGWSVSLKDSKKEIGKKYKQYKVCFVCVCAIADALQEVEVSRRAQHKPQHGMEQALTRNCLAQASDIANGCKVQHSHCCLHMRLHSLQQSESCCLLVQCSTEVQALASLT